MFHHGYNLRSKCKSLISSSQTKPKLTITTESGRSWTSVRASLPKLSMWPCTINLTRGSSTGKDYWNPEKYHDFESPGWALHESLINTVKSFLLIAPCFWLARSIHWSKWVAISTGLTRTCNPSFSFMGGVAKKYSQSKFQFYGWGCKKVCEKTKTWMWEIFLEGHILNCSGDALVLSMNTMEILVMIWNRL